jgi:ligand-binding sensor protein
VSESLIEQRFALEDLLDLPTLRDVTEAFASCFSVGIFIVDEHGKELTRHGPVYTFCKLVSEGLGEDSRCKEVKNKILQHPITGTSAIQIQAFCGFKYAAFPLIYQFNVIGRVVLGPYRDDELKRERLPGLSNIKDQEQLYQAVEATPLINPQYLKSITRFLAKIMDAFIFINAKRLVTTHMHLESIMQAREQVFQQIEKESSGTPEARRNLEKLKQMF